MTTGVRSRAAAKCMVKYRLLSNGFVVCAMHWSGNPRAKTGTSLQEGPVDQEDNVRRRKDEVFPSKVTVAQPECAAAMRPSPNRCGHVR